MTELSRQQDLILEMLMKYDFPLGNRRLNIRRTGHDIYRGFSLGLVQSWAGKGEKAGYRKLISLATQKPKNRGRYQESRKLIELYDPQFEYTSIQYNQNYQCAKHQDKNNVGYSYIIGLGDYTGGELIVYDKDDNPTSVDIHNKFFKFNGSLSPHETAPFTGERYTLVFYSIK